MSASAPSATETPQRRENDITFRITRREGATTGLDRLLKCLAEDGFFSEYLKRDEATREEVEFASAAPFDENDSEWRFVIQLVDRLLRANDLDSMTIVREKRYIDSAYRDSYYSYYSRQHFEMPRYSQRLSFFAAEIDPEDVLLGKLAHLGDALLATCVINPLAHGSIGRTLIDPRRWARDGEACVRCSSFEVNIYGCEFHIDAFPYRKQDKELTRCAEVTLLNIIDYYSSKYPDYAAAYGTQIRAIEERYSYESGAPSRGISYTTLSRILFELGFSPRLYNIASLGGNYCSRLTPIDRFHRLAHYHIESGIPLALSTEPVSGPQDGHSLIVVGYERDLTGQAGKDRAWANRIAYSSTVKPPAGPADAGAPQWQPAKAPFVCNLMDSADFFSRYVVIDDNQMPYALGDFENLSVHAGLRSSTAVAPLNKSMVLDALDAQRKITALLTDPRHGVIHWGGAYLEELALGSGPEGVSLVMRLFMASARSFKRFRVDHARDDLRRAVYSGTPFPRFVWVCELYAESDFLGGGNAFAEVVLDATSDVEDIPSKNVIISNYPNTVGYRFPETEGVGFHALLKADPGKGIVPYSSNLQHVSRGAAANR